MAPVKFRRAGASIVDPELWLIDIAASAAALEGAEAKQPLLSRSDGERIASLSDAEMRQSRRVSHIALRLLIERAFGSVWRQKPYVISESGKPLLEGLEGGFSLSHTRGFALIGLSPKGAIGVDIERARPVRIPQGRRDALEHAGVVLAGGMPLQGDDPDERLLMAWVRFEAVAKAEGCGIGPLLARFGLGRREIAAEMVDIDFLAHDVEAGSGVFAAAALPVGLAPGEPRLLPHTAEGLETLIS